MAAPPRFTYFLSHDTPVEINSAKWRKPIPQNRQSFTTPHAVMPHSNVTYGDYFTAVRTFLAQNGFSLLTHALSRQTGRPVDLGEVRDVAVHLEKHGALYHPSRMVITVSGQTFLFVLNVAVSAAGKEVLKREYRVLEALGRQPVCSGFLPPVYGMGEVQAGDRITAAMFLGRWFEGFHEFHLSFDAGDEQKKIQVWDPVRGPFFLASQQVRALYRQAAMVLTCCYDVQTGEQVFPWSHAAGDFVLKQTPDSVALKLISARDYRPLMAVDSADAGSMLQALMVFLTNLTLWMRLDRIDGVHDMVWADDLAVEETVRGVFEGLAARPAPNIFGDPLDACFTGYLAHWTRKELQDLFEEIVGIYPPNTPDIALIKKKLNRHSDLFYETVQNLR